MTKREMIFADLNKEQEEALLYFDTPLRLIAGAGSGKTRVLTRKIAFLINEIGIPANQILAVTFTNKAAAEMQERVQQYCNLQEEEKINAQTFHSLCAKILRIDGEEIGIKRDFVIIDEIEKKQIINRICKNIDYDPDNIDTKSLIKLFSWAKVNMFDKEELEQQMLKKDDLNKVILNLYEKYNETLKKEKYLDFDDLIIKTNELFKKSPIAVDRWSKMYSFILVDEFQDTSLQQYEILKVLTSKNAHITIVGDPDQTIYSWRKADVNLILNFDKDFPNTKTIVLNTNYRSTKKILNAANNLIKHNSKRFIKDLVTENEEGDDIVFNHAFSQEAEARWVIQKINELKKNKVQLKNIAIFYRSNWYSRIFEEALINEGIHHKIFSGQKFFHRKEIKDALAFLRVIYDGSEVYLQRILNVPPRKIGVVALEKIEKKVKETGLSLYDTLVEYHKDLKFPKETVKEIVNLLNSIKFCRKALETNKISLVLEEMLNRVNYYEYIKADPNLRGTALENVKELINSIDEWERKNPDKKINQYLEHVSLLSAGDEFDNFSNYVSLMTVHAAKGLEFENVFIVGLSDQLFPHNRSLTSSDDEKEQLEEERRLAYVAITRAKKRLFISDSRGTLFDTKTEKIPSRFISEMGINIDDFIIQNNIVSNFDEENDNKKANNKIIVGDYISHTTFGEGQVVYVDNWSIEVKFLKFEDTKKLSKNHSSIRLLK
ncbi:ATP-dependent helicase [Mycoplasmopsis hyopharyngis]|uniref:ATP-dependent helicase n=1 Tax=Mycoplasmopsis hyopharyngis TaxID=29558 RepID=UPI0038736F11